MPSRMRRATLRITLESSTTKQDFITGTPPSLASFLLCLCSGGTAADVEHTVNVENDQKLAFEPVHARSHAAEARIEIGRLRLAFARGKLHHFADRIDQQPVGFALELDADRHDRTARRAGSEVEPGAHLD